MCEPTEFWSRIPVFSFGPTLVPAREDFRVPSDEVPGEVEDRLRPLEPRGVDVCTVGSGTKIGVYRRKGPADTGEEYFCGSGYPRPVKVPE